MKTILKIISTYLLATNAVFAFTATKTQQSEIFQGLQNTKLIRASDGIPTTLTSQWRQNTPFGVADETAVVAFLRHFG